MQEKSKQGIYSDESKLCFKEMILHYVRIGDILLIAKMNNESKQIYDAAFEMCNSMIHRIPSNDKSLIIYRNELITMLKRKVLPCIDRIQSITITQDYEQDTKYTKVYVKWVNDLNGKELFSKEEFSPGDILLTEEPIVSQRHINDDSIIETCERCMKSLNINSLRCACEIICDNQQSSDSMFQLLAQHEKQYPPGIQVCICDCGAKYCSDTCKKLAWEQYHNVMCDSEVLEELVQLSKSLGRNNPVLICKMMACCVSTALSTWNMDEQDDDEESILKESTYLFDRFVQNEERHGGDVGVVEVIKKMFYKKTFKSLTKKSMSFCNIMDEIITLSRYRNMNGLILRNACTIIPVSQFHVFLQSINPSQFVIDELSRILVNSCGHDLTYLLSHPKLQDRLSVVGFGPFAIHNCCNHSCDSNCASVSNLLDHRVRLIATKSIHKDSAISISYIGNDCLLSKQERQSQLLEKYDFQCLCTKCQNKP
ncbi:hypothetical protein AKO1_013211 [Acrasis kona]|uniref:SET domain-containing protein n=1 Tax=Acrasis kona TaxID=1008807 RepID=A0AAW2Z0G4_9EUKA